MKKLIALVLTLFGFLLCQPAFARHEPLALPGRIALAAENGDINQNKNAIIKAGAMLDWTVVADQPGKLSLKHVKGNHELVLDVVYDATGYQLRYGSSVDLNYKQTQFGAEIHPIVNHWAANLVKFIGGKRTDLDTPTDKPTASQAK
ncbi:hypothetical protein CXB49_00825 [Chromobacterium sp. ATCC 53434]|uniref:hypothetical protein n=1 Tax=Chromobacterium sp. (strain ATCC 53434 / SC 14030) TaxID=2059672 RepID=UPI000C782AC6|nr:hypothetical protein [Chromobacterium sp. ATCC 53434]AUH49483.1 hypothetical protein CXB49_00825 [Chromobacterium sp. ATCC 53434]